MELIIIRKDETYRFYSIISMYITDNIYTLTINDNTKFTIDVKDVNHVQFSETVCGKTCKFEYAGVIIHSAEGRWAIPADGKWHSWMREKQIIPLYGISSR